MLLVPRFTRLAALSYCCCLMLHSALPFADGWDFYTGDASVYDNIALGLRFRGKPRREVMQTTQEWLERLGIASLDELPPIAEHLPDLSELDEVLDAVALGE